MQNSQTEGRKKEDSTQTSCCAG